MGMHESLSYACGSWILSRAAAKRAIIKCFVIEFVAVLASDLDNDFFLVDDFFRVRHNI